DARLVLANHTAASMWGAEWPQGRPMQAFLPAHGIRILTPTGQPQPIEQLATMRALRGDLVRQQAETIRHASGTTLPVVVSAVPLDPRILSSDDELGLSSVFARPESRDQHITQEHEKQAEVALQGAPTQQRADQLVVRVDPEERAGGRSPPEEQLQPIA